MRKLRGLAALAALTCLIPAAAGGQQRNLDAYASRLAVYRSGDFATALRASMALPFDRLRDQAEEFARGLPAGAPGVELDLLAAAMIHLDLAWAAEMEPEKNEEIARDFLNRLSGARRDVWTRDAHLGLLGIYVDQGRLDDSVRVARFLRDEYPDPTAVRVNLARLAEFIGWGIHDERFLDQAQESYQNLLDEGEGDPAELRLRLAHLTLREGNPEEALRRLDDAGDDLSARHRFVSLLLRGETLLWLDQVAAAETAFEAAQAIHVGSLSAAAGLAAARQTLGDGRRAAGAVRRFLSGTSGQDTWWHFLVQALADETGRLDQLRGLALLPEQ
ncbi:MAG: hypothetical protein OXP70_14990 [Acidobacteriota bacterium]|nr:hypothetical protein [Acidobacteriota bacterium]